MPITISDSRDAIAKLVKQFRTNQKAYCGPGYKEAHVRQEFVNPFFVALGWDVHNSQQAAPGYREVILEDSMEDEGRKRAPDYAFRVGKDRKFFVEAKRPAIDLKNDPGPAYQIRQYGWNVKLPFSLLTNFGEFSIYDCRFRPSPKDKANVARDRYLTYEEYMDHWQEIWDVFSREAVWSGSFDQHAEVTEKHGSTEVDIEFLTEIERWRIALAHNIALKNPDLQSGEEVGEVVQLIIDRIIFLRMAEDRGMEDFGQLGALAQEGDIYRSLLHLVRKADSRYNSGLFNTSASGDRLSPRVVIDDKPLRDLLVTLYAPLSPYNFRLLPPEILGQVYERFLGKVIRLTAGHHAKVEDKPEVKKAGGVYYTPNYVVDFIVQRTVGQRIEKKSPSELETFRIVDPACGSGSFLLAAYQCLLDHYWNWYVSHRPEKHPKAVWKYGTPSEDEARPESWRLTTSEKKRILLAHIFGVDIDHQAVEVTKLSLLLKVLEDEDEDSLNRQLALFSEKALPDLDANIRCGNSLIDFSDQLLQADNEEYLRIVNPFDWKQEFPLVMKSGGFDCIIGNPPYLSVDDTWGRGDPRLVALKVGYPLIYNDKTDILFYFLGRSIELCKGSIGFIVSRAFLEAYKADRLRKYLVDKCAIREVIDFRNYPVFRGVGISTCIVVLEPGAKKGRIVARKLLADSLANFDLAGQLSKPGVFETVRIAQSKLPVGPPWVFSAPEVRELNAKIDSAGHPLAQLLVIGQGMQTGENDVFGNRADKELRRWHLKPGLFYKRASNSDIERFFIRDRGEYILYLEDVERFEELPKGLRDYLKGNAQLLKGRAAYKRGDCEWWKYTWPLHKELYPGKRLLCPYLATYNRFALDSGGEFLGLTDTTVLFDASSSEDLLYILGVLNSQLLTFRFQSIGKLKGAGIYEYFWNSISKLPIRRIRFDEKQDKALHDRMVSLVKHITQSYRHREEATANRRKLHERQIASVSRQIDGLVYELYGLTDEEIEIVEAKTGGLIPML